MWLQVYWFSDLFEEPVLSFTDFLYCPSVFNYSDFCFSFFPLGRFFSFFSSWGGSLFSFSLRNPMTQVLNLFYSPTVSWGSVDYFYHSVFFLFFRLGNFFSSICQFIDSSALLSLPTALLYQLLFFSSKTAICFLVRFNKINTFYCFTNDMRETGVFLNCNCMAVNIMTDTVQCHCFHSC